jgi:cyclophilin family peptidyl-prolyl cis-trans isomerase
MRTKLFVVIVIILIGVCTMSNLEASENVNVKMVTNKGTIELELYTDKAPITVENFVKYANDGFFNGTVFHRVINNFMIQGGGFTIEGTQKKDTYDQIQNEADNMISNKVGS